MNSRMNLNRWASIVLIALIVTVSLSVFAAPKKKTKTKKKKKRTNRENILQISKKKRCFAFF